MRRWLGWERSRVQQINPTLTPPALTKTLRERLDHDVGCQKALQFGGEGGIRTLGPSYPGRQISNLVPSTTRPPLRIANFARNSADLRPINMPTERVRIHRFLAKFWHFWRDKARRRQRSLHSFGIPTVRLVRPARVMTDNHRYRRVTHLVGHVKRIQPLGKKQCGISVPALVERPLAQPCEAKQPEPRPPERPSVSGDRPLVS